MPTGYCMRCKTQREMENFETYVSEKMKRNQKTGEMYMAQRVMGRGTCPECHTKMSRAFGKPGGSRVTYAGVCPECNQTRQIPDDDYVCVACRKEMSN